ncbi:hypothetical protein AAFF_G00392450 [Aldrovandia affinis]|uniref:Stabilin-2 n=1 Tax=Aldrovandia affinis TaxID=143900 RepID=A0AAD7SE65_9TELE|nr:hypothetical protein AAFF_G00392450 [Aldrovandia affinis]
MNPCSTNNGGCPTNSTICVYTSPGKNCGASMPVRGPGPLTVFVPTNNAVDRFRDGSLIYMMTEAQHKLQELLKHHMFSSASITVDQIASMTEIQTMANQIIGVNVTSDGRIFLGEKGILLETTDIVASNGVIHMIDGVLVPPSIVPILPHRCDVSENKITVGSCVKCSYLYDTHCPPGSTELDSHLRDCEYQSSPMSSLFSNKGCAKYCNTTRVRKECCKGFYGPDCKPCIGGFKTPCYDKGTCSDGINGDGTCSCNHGFIGVACHICSGDTKHGENCDEGYKGDGDSCTVFNPCLKPNRGGCDPNAQCVYAGPANVSCACNEGWTGDGLVCAEINNCLLESRGGCHDNASCDVIGPGQSECTCVAGYMGDGKVCDIINPCLSDNGGCHMQARCEVRKFGGHVCICPGNYGGDGKSSCYGTILEELDSNWVFFGFNRIIQQISLTLDGNVTALVPTTDIIRNFYSFAEDIWLDPYRLPYLLKAHFLDGIFTYEDLQQHFNKELATMNPGTKWEIKNASGNVMIQNATIRVADIPAVNGYIHIIDMILRPSLSDVPPLPLTLMEFLNHTPTFSLFREAALTYNLTDSIKSKEYTVLIPTNEAINEHLNRTNSTTLGEDVFKYHVIIDAQLFPEHLGHGVSKTTLLGSSFQILFHTNSQNQTLANEVLLSENVNETYKGVVISIPHVLEIHKNRCNKQIIITKQGICTSCDSTPRCSYDNKPVRSEFSPNMKPNCRFRQRIATRRRTVLGCVVDCFGYLEDHSCCPGYFGHSCLKCPGKIDNWCSNNGKCQDGVLGSGECLCNEGFHGTACEDCESGKYGKDCKSVCTCSHGKCLDGMDGNGKCLCYKGWRGETCSQEIIMDACGGVCDINANCITGTQGIATTCLCVAGYEGNGTICKEINPCDSYNGHCSQNANCTKTLPGERSCTCHEGFTGDGVVCLEIDNCAENNGGCHVYAECIKTGPSLVDCNCKTGFSGSGHFCYPVNICRKNNGGCSRNARCEYLGPGERNCTCRYSHIGDGITCKGTIKAEIIRHPDALWFNRNLQMSKVTDLLTKGPLTAFVPHTDYSQNFTMEPWVNASRAADLLRYHLVGCEQLLVADLQSIGKVVAISGHVLRFAVREGDLYINEDTKIITSDYVTFNGVIHFIDKVLIPYDLKNKSRSVSPMLNVTAAAETYGYTMFSKLLQTANLMSMVQNSLHHPFTMFWPTDEVFSSLPEERKKWLYSEDHRDKLAAYLKAHIIRDTKLLAVNLPHQDSVRTMYGSSYSFTCDKTNVGDILVDDGNAKLVERHMMFDVGIAHGINQLLEPPNMGARCDDFEELKHPGRCGTCFSTPMLAEWLPRCCANHFGRDCQVCPGGLEAPCSNHGECMDGIQRTGNCVCRTGFTGTACELCEHNHYGFNCTSCACTQNGRCNDGLDGDGSCFCREGWTGAQCESKLGVKPTCTPECHPNAMCQPENMCVCESFYEGNGRNCTAPDLCSENNGGCHQHANCKQTGINITCTCLSAYTGDGYSCSPIDRCVEEANGGCSDFATCLFTGPNERECQCYSNYVGNGVECQEKVVPLVNPCLEDNGGCDSKANCQNMPFHDKTAEVFLLRSPLGKYKLTYADADAACKAEGATLATFSQLSEAQKRGMHLCIQGWMDGKQVGYPISSPSIKCGNNHVGVVIDENPVDTSRTYDAYCYRVEDTYCECRPEYIGNGEYCNGNLASVLANNANFSVFYLTLLNYAISTKDGENLMNVLLRRSTTATLFVPENAGFYGNETLSWRDMEYHISTNNSIYLYQDLEHGAVIPNRLGYNLSVTISSTNTTRSDGAQLYKLVNGKFVVYWDIPATNGIIHVIKEPLEAPPPPVELAVSSPSDKTQSKSGAVTSVLVTFLIIAIVAGLGYYFLKQRNDGFRFQYFKDDDDEGSPKRKGLNPALVSIPNPLYTGYNAFTEPFGDSPEVDSSKAQHILD